MFEEDDKNFLINTGGLAMGFKTEPKKTLLIFIIAASLLASLILEGIKDLGIVAFVLAVNYVSIICIFFRKPETKSEKNLQESLIETDRNLIIKDANKLTEKLTGYSNRELLGKNASILYKNPDLVEEKTKEVQGPLELDRVELLRKDGSTIICRQILAPRENGFLISSTDITSIAHLEKMLLEKTVNLERLLEEMREVINEKNIVMNKLLEDERYRIVGIMASGAAHTFNNILSIILGSMELMEKKDIPEKFKKDLERLKKAALKGARTVMRLQELARVGSDKDEIIDLSASLDTVVEAFKPLVIQKETKYGRKIEIDTKLESPLPVMGNPAQLREAITNILSFSLDEVDEGRILVEGRRYAGRIEVLFELPNTILEEEDIEKLFNPFESAKKEGDLGSGLTIAKWVVERHGGTIDVETFKNTTRIKVSLPEALQRHEEEQAEGPKLLKKKKLKVLVADDEEDVAEILEEFLESLGNDVEKAFNGREALEKFKVAAESGNPFDVVLADITMPEMDGFELSKRLYEDFSFDRVILITGWDREVPSAKLKGIKIKKIITKPFTLNEIKEALAEV